MSKKYVVKLSDSMCAKLETAADENEMLPSEYIRDVLRDDLENVKPDPAVLRAIRKPVEAEDEPEDGDDEEEQQ